MQYRKDVYSDYDEQELVIRRQAQAQIGRVRKIEQRYLEEMVPERDSSQLAYSTQMPADNGISSPFYDDYLSQNRRTANVIESGPAPKRYRGLDEAAMEQSDPYRQQQQYKESLRNVGIGAYESIGDGPGADYEGAYDYRQQQLATLEDFDFDGERLSTNNRKNFRFGDQETTENRRQFESQKVAPVPPGYVPDSAYTCKSIAYDDNTTATGGGGRNTLDDLDIAEKYCKDLYRAEQEESERRKAAIRAEIEKISSARTVYPSRMENEVFHQRSITAVATDYDSQPMQIRQQQRSIPSESMAAAELRSLLSAMQKSSSGPNAGEAMMGRQRRDERNVPFITPGPYNDPDTRTTSRLAPTNRPDEDAGPWAYGSSAIAPQTYDRIEMENRISRMKTLIPTDSPNEEFFSRSRKQMFGGDKLIKNQMTTTAPAYTRENPSQTQEIIKGFMRPLRPNKPAPINIPSGKIYDKNVVTEMEKRRHGSELRKLLSAPKNAEIWVETCTNELRIVKKSERRLATCYFYNAVTGETTYRAPTNPTRDGFPVHIVKREELTKILAISVPQTLVVKTKITRDLTDHIFRSYFEQFGKVTVAKVLKLSKRSSSGGKKIAILRMSTLDGQENVLAFKEHKINGHQSEVTISQNRLLISRLPDGCFPSEISRFLSEQARELDPEVFPAVIDTYMCTPFPQFCFAALGGRSIGSKLAQAGDLLVKGRRVYLNLCIVGINLNPDANEVYVRKMEEYTVISNTNQKMRQMLKALQSVSETVKQMLESISECPKYNRVFTLRTLLARLNSGFGGGYSLEESQNYRVSMELILEMCLDLANKLGILTDPAEFHSYVASGISAGQQLSAKEEGDEDAADYEVIDEGEVNAEQGTEGKIDQKSEFFIGN